MPVRINKIQRSLYFIIAVKIKIIKRRTFADPALQLSLPLLKKREKKDKLSLLPRKRNYLEMRERIIVIKKAAEVYCNFS